MNPFGPLLPFELTRIVRKRWLTLGRTVYALVLAAAVIVTYVVYQSNNPRPSGPGALAEITQELFFGLFGLQAALVCLSAPRWIADAITGEKERQTLSFLLLTDLTSREIILGKLVARLAQLLMFPLAGLPILVVLQVFGGVEPALALVCYAALFVTLLSLGCLSMLYSVYSRTTKAATVLISRTLGLYVLVVVIVGSIVMRAWPAVGAFPGTTLQPAVFSVQDLFGLLNAGNPIDAVQRVAGGLGSGDTLWPTFRDYLLFHLTVAAGCGVWAMRQLRPVAASQGDGPPIPARRTLFKPRRRPPIGDRPVQWKALYLDNRPNRSAAGRVFARIVFVLSFAPMTVSLIVDYHFNQLRNAAEIMNVLCRAFVTVGLTGMMVVIAGQACASIGRERSKRTLDELLLTDLSATEILAQKWWGSVSVVRLGLVWVAIHWLVGVLTGGLHILAIPLLVVEWSVFTMFSATLGIYFAARMFTTQGANAGTGLVGFTLGALPVIFGAAIIQLLPKLNSLGMTLILMSPPAVLGVSAFSPKDLHPVKSDFLEIVRPIVIGLLISLIACGLLSWRLWRGACWWFPRIVGRR